MKPDRVHEHDAQWASDLVNRLPQHLRVPTCIAYTNAFDEAFSTESALHKKLNKARRAANTRLRVYVKKFIELNPHVEWSFNK